jgi:hypothetical protein
MQPFKHIRFMVRRNSLQDAIELPLVHHAKPLEESGKC